LLLLAVSLLVAGSAAAAEAELVVQTGHTFPIKTAMYLPSGKSLLTAGYDRTARLWEIATGREVRVFRGHTGTIVSVAVSSDEQKIFTASDDGEIRQWDAKTATVVRTFTGHQGAIRSMALSPDNTTLVSTGRDGTTRLWSVSTGALLKKLTFGNFNFNGFTYDGVEEAESVTFTPDGLRIIVGGGPGLLVRYVVATGEIDSLWGLRDAKGEQVIYPPVALSMSRNGRWLAAAVEFGDTTAFILDAENARIAYRLGSKDWMVRSLAISPDNRHLVTGTGGKQGERLQVFDMVTGKEKLTFKGTGREAAAIAISPDGGTLASCDRSIRLFDYLKGFVVQEMGTRVEGLTSLTSLNDGAQLVSGGRDTTLRFWDVQSLRQTQTVPVAGWRTAAVSPDGKLAASVEERGVTLYALPSGKQLRKFEGFKSWLNSVTFSPDGELLFVGGSEAAVVYETGSGAVLKNFGGLGEVTSSVFSPDGRTLVLGMRADELLLWKVGSDGPPEKLSASTKGHVRAVRFSPDGKLLAVGGGEAVVGNAGGRVMLYDVATRKLVRTLSGHEVGVMALAFSPDGKKLVSGSGSLMRKEPNPVRLWEVASGKLLAQLSGHTTDVTGAAFSKDGSLFFTASEDGSLRGWSVKAAAQVLTLAGGGEDWFVADAQGLFDASPGGGQLVAMVKGTQAFSIDQFAVRNNRPDLLLSRLNLGTPETLAHYRVLFDRRLRRLGLKESQLSGALQVPEAKILSAKRDGQTARVTFKLSESSGQLVRYSLFVNDVPIFGAGGKPVTGREREITEDVALTPGPNKIEVSCTNDRGAESFRALASVPVEGTVPRNLWFLGFGVSDYQDERLKLQYAHKDAQNLGALFSTMKGSVFQNVHVKTLVDAEVTPDSIQKAKSFVMAAKPDDVFVLFIAGHGVHAEDPEATYYYLTHGARVDDLPKTAARFELIEDLLQGIPPRSKLFLMDTCESGEAEPAQESSTFELAAGNKLAPRAARGLKRKETKAAGPHARAYLLQRDRYIYNDLQRRSGAIVFSSSRGGEFSYEKAELQAGLFTDAVRRALTTKQADVNGDRQVSTDELRSFVAKAVSESSDDLQHPTVDRDNLFQKFAFPVVAP
jgi:WD40 repeat protein